MLLASLSISEWNPDTEVRLAMQPEGIALVGDGLRDSEACLLEEGIPQRFPMLIEVDPSRNTGGPRVIGFSDIVQLVFRSQDEADAFRFRAVDEFDPAVLAHAVEPTRFGLIGEARFSLRESRDMRGAHAGRLADRLAAGLCFAVAIASMRPICRPAIAEFVEGASEGAMFDETIDLQAACVAMTGADAEQLTCHQRAVVRAFARAENLSRGAMLDIVMEEFSSGGRRSAESQATEAHWEALTRKVIRGEVVLDGERLGDDKSVLLRGALLGLAADTPEALCAFLDADKPSGPRVTVLAAFLAGLKTGLAAMPWPLKAPNAGSLGTLSAELARAASSAPDKLSSVARVARTMTAEGMQTKIEMDGLSALGEWLEADPVENRWLQKLEEERYRIIGRGYVPRSWRVQFPHGYEVEIVVREAGGRQFALLTWSLDPGSKPKKADVTAACEGSARIWLPGKDAAGNFAFVCALPSLPSLPEVDVLADLLHEVKRLCVPEKKSRTRRKKSTES